MSKKFAGWLCLAALLVVLIPVGIWWLSFGVGFSGSTEQWAHFATFVSGISLPVLTVGSVIAILLTLKEQRRSNEAQSEANEKAEADRLRSMELANEIEDKKDRRHKEQIIADVHIECVRRVLKLTDGMHTMVTSELGNIVSDNVEAAVLVRKVIVELNKLVYTLPTDIDRYSEGSRRLIGFAVSNTKALTVSIEHSLRDPDYEPLTEAIKQMVEDVNEIYIKYKNVVDELDS
tara:strand:+ start:554 stop:1252 length:699 start_codon:yes stop_codon:yes gene_type:complete